MKNPSKLQRRFANATMEVRIIPYLVNWLFQRGLPPGWGK